MRRIDAILITLVVFMAGGVFYLILQSLGLDGLNAGVWSQFILVIGLIGWIGSYLFRVANKNMTYNQQVKQYEDSVLQKRLEEMTPQELEKLQAEIEAEKKAKD